MFKIGDRFRIKERQSIPIYSWRNGQIKRNGGDIIEASRSPAAFPGYVAFRDEESGAPHLLLRLEDVEKL